MGAWDYIQAIIVIAAVIYAAYYVTKLAARTAAGPARGRGIRMRANLPLGRDKSVAMVEIGSNAYVLGVSAQRVELLDKFPLTELGAPEEDGPPAPEFADVFKREFDRRIGKLRK